MFSGYVLLNQQERVLAEIDTQTVRPNGDFGTTNNFATNSGGSDTSCTGGTHCDYVDEADDAEWLGTGTGMNSTTAEEEFDFGNITLTDGTLDAITNVAVTVRAQVITQGGGTNDGISVRLFIDGAYHGTTNTATLTGSATNHTFTWSGLNEPTAADIRVEIIRTVAGSGSPNSQDDDIRLFEVKADVTFTYLLPQSELTLEGYIFENDDGDAGGAGEEIIDAPSFNLLTSGSGNGTSINTSSISPGSHTLLLASVATAIDGSGSGATLPTMSGNGLTWVQIETQISGDDGRLTLFRAMGAAPTSGQVTISTGVTTNDIAWTITEIDNVDTSGSNGSGAVVQSEIDSGAVSPLQVDLATFADVTNPTYGSFYLEGDCSANDITAGSGFTELVEVDHTSGGQDLALNAQWRADADTSVDASFCFATDNVGVAVEILPIDTSIEGALSAGSGVNDSSTGTQNWATPENIVADDGSNASFAGPSDVTSRFLKATDFGFSIPDTATITGIRFDLRVLASDNTVNDKVVDNIVSVVKGGAIMTEDKSDASPWPTTETTRTKGGPTDLWGETWTPREINDSDFGFAISVDLFSTDFTSGSIDHITATVYYTGALGLNSVTAGSEFSSGKTLAEVRQGERINLRAQLTNSGGPFNIDKELALFYERDNDGFWTKAGLGPPGLSGSGNCDDNNGGSDEFNCTLVAANSGSSESVGHYGKIRVSRQGSIWSAYRDLTDGDLWAALYVGRDGNCDTLAGGSDAWNCTLVAANTGASESLGVFVSMDFDRTGAPWISFQDTTDNDFWVVSYVGSGGNCDSSNGGSDAWNCTLVAGHSGGSEQVGLYSSIAFNNLGRATASFYDNTDGDLWVASFVGSGGNCDSTNGGSDAWNCTLVAAHSGTAGEFVGLYTSISFDGSNNAWISYFDSGDNTCSGETDECDLWVATHVGGGNGNCDTNAGGHGDWSCEKVAEHGGTAGEDVGNDTSLALDPSGKPWVIFHEEVTNGGGNFWAASFVGSGGNCDANNGGSDAWKCTLIAANSGSTENVGLEGEIAFSPGGEAWATFHDATDNDIWTAQYVGSGGNCDANNGGSDEWNCTLLAAHSGSTEQVGRYSSLAFKSDGSLILNFYDSTDGDFWVAESLSHGSEILIAPAQNIVKGDTLAQSHVDMTSTTDTTNLNDADCLDGSSDWNDGVYFGSENGDGLLIPDGRTTNQCTEVMWTIDTSQAVAGSSYRFVVTTNDGFKPDKGIWRAPTSVATDGYPALTIRGDDKTAYRYSKQTNGGFGTDCTDTNWSCTVVDDQNLAAGGDGVALAFSPSGTPWMAYRASGNGDLVVAEYVGAGGNCDTYSTSSSGSEAWQCTVVNDTVGSTGIYPELAFDPAGNPWVSYRNGSVDMEVANYVGSGGNCTNTAWQCTIIDTTQTASGEFSSIAFNQAGVPFVSYSVNPLSGTRHLLVATYVGTGGNCVNRGGSSAWQCTIVDSQTAEIANAKTSLAFDPTGTPWIGYEVEGNLICDTADECTLNVAKYVGSGGNCDTYATGSAGSDAWQCTVIESNAFHSGAEVSLSFDPSGKAWMSYHDYGSGSNDSLMLAEYVGTGGNCDNTAWQCTTIDDQADNVGHASSLAFDSAGNPWISYLNFTDDSLVVANYVGSGGDCDSYASGSGSDAWECTIVQDTAENLIQAEEPTVLAFDPSGTPWVAYHNETDQSVELAKLKMPPNPLSSEVLVPYNGRNASSGDLRYHLNSGLAPYTDSYGTCAGNSNYSGYCGLYHPDGMSDSITALVNEQPMYAFSTRYPSNATAPAARVYFRTSLSPATANVVLQVYRYGSTNDWETVSTYSSAGCDTTNCTIVGEPTGTISEYFEADGSNYWMHYRLYQVASNSSFITFYLDSFTAPQTFTQLRNGRVFRELITDPLRW